MNMKELSPELQALLGELSNAPKSDYTTLEARNKALAKKPGFVAKVIAGVFVTDMLNALASQKLNANKLAKKWGKSRQQVSTILNREDPKNFTLKTIVELSMQLGLRPKPIQFESIDSFSQVVPVKVSKPEKWIKGTFCTKTAAPAITPESIGSGDLDLSTAAA